MRATRPVTLCGEQVSGFQHVCAFFESREEQYEVLNPYFREGIENGEQLVTVVEAAFLDEHAARMRAGGVQVDAAAAAGQLQMLTADETYTLDGKFAVDRMCSFVEQALASAERGPYGRVRTCGDMEWALRDLPGSDELMRYEARVNMLAPRHDCTLLCVYDLNRFSGRAIADLLATHSHVILGGRIVQNPYFIDPVSYLQTLVRRRTAVPLGAGS